MNGEGTYYGKYRGTCINNEDPQKMGRIQAIVPDVSSLLLTSWALPCVPIAGKQQGVFMVPQFGAGVWIEFEQGDPDYPIWTGGFWGSAAEVPALVLAPPTSPGQNIVMQTTGQNTLVLSDSAPTPVSGGIVLKSPGGATIVVNDSGIYIDNGKGASLVMAGSVVTVNKGALVVN